MYTLKNGVIAKSYYSYKKEEQSFIPIYKKTHL